MYCTNCGEALNKNNMYCTKCGTKQEEIVKANDTVEVNNHLANVLCTISLCLYFGMPILSVIIYIITFGLTINADVTDSGVAGLFLSGFSLVAWAARIAAYVLMIIARVKCPKSTYAKVVMWIYIALFVMGLVALVVMMITCAGILVECARHF